MKVRHFDTAFRASLLLFVAFCSSVALSEGEGTCYLTQYPSGEYVIRCEGDGIWVNYVEQTNEVYIIKNCEQLKANLLAAVESLEGPLQTSINEYENIAAESVGMLGEVYVRTNSFLSASYNYLYVSATNGLQGLSSFQDSLFGEPSLRSLVEGIECGSCSTNGSGSCCDVDLTPILLQLNMANNTLSSVTNLLFKNFRLANRQYYRFLLHSDAKKPNDATLGRYDYISDTANASVLGILDALQRSLSDTQASINNYLYRISFYDIPVISTNLHVVADTVTNLYIASTNHFSFFRQMTFQDSPLIDYSQQSTFDSYYDFLTNHYVKVSFKQYNSLVGDEKAKTNWFSRIETLLAALVFNDSEGTNTVDDTYGQSQQDNLINSLDGMNQTSTTQVNLMSNMGDSLLASLRSLNSSFSSAVSMPGEVRLASVGQDNSIQSNTIKFQSSEISQLVEACHCATTLAWCFGGIWLLFLFVSWSIKTSYSLCVFCWSVVSAIFGGGKT